MLGTGSGMWLSGASRLRLDEAITQARVLNSELESHMKECDRRYREMDEAQERRHQENSHRMDRQDAVLSKLLWGVVVAACSTVGILAESLLRALNVHIGAG